MADCYCLGDAICAPISDTKQTLDWPCLCKTPSVVCVEVVVLLCFQPLCWREQLFQRPAAVLHNWSTIFCFSWLFSPAMAVCLSAPHSVVL